jgi:drug/metabolite transporter (DMT)-like permease
LLVTVVGVRRRDPARVGMLFGVVAAAAFGASTPFAKRLLGDVGPQMLAGLLYLGAFVVLALALPSRRRRGEAPLRRSDLPRLAGVVTAGGVVAPVLMLVGLERVSGMTGSLLLNLEGPFTLVLALAFFGEHLGRRTLVGSVTVFAAAALLSVGGPVAGDQVLGVVLIGAAAALWALDNNLTQSLTGRDPFAIVAVKAGVAAVVNLGLAVLLGAGAPAARVVLGAMVLGAVAYGASILFDAYALRLIGAARESAVFATAPFIGVLLSVPVLRERLDVVELVATVMMAAGVVVLFRDRHEHLHAHDPLEHEHVHRHDDLHHDHDHGDGVDPTVAHSHPHRHEPMVHSHPHVSDSHHRHDHDRSTD